MRHLLISCLWMAILVKSMGQNPVNSLAPTPPMGWNSWNAFRCDVSEELIMEIADAMVANGLRDAGYEYVVIDDCWQTGRDSAGNILADPERFPLGIKALSDYVHSLGLKFGLYSCAGVLTCEGRPALRGYEFQDMQQFANWGVDYTKIDWCYSSSQDAKASYSLIRDAIRASGRPMVLSICEWGTQKPWEWGEGTGNLWRTTFDIRPLWNNVDTVVRSNGTVGEHRLSFDRILDRQVGLEQYAGPGHWNDPDMLEVGNGELIPEENRAHFSLWAILAAPLMLGNDIRDISPEILSILTNEEVIAVNQDPLGKQGVKVRDDGDYEVWSKQLADGSRAVILFNRSEWEHEIELSWTELGYPSHLKASIRDLWLGKETGSHTKNYSARVQPHGVVMLIISPE